MSTAITGRIALPDATDLIDRFVNPLFLSAAPYDATHHDFAWRQQGLARLMSNECPLPPSAGVLKAIDRAANVGNLYPHSGQDLRAALAEFNDVPVEGVVLGNGSTEVLDVLVRLLLKPGDNSVIATPTYAFFTSQTLIYGGNPRIVPLGPGFTLDVDGMLAQIDERTKIIFLCSPNNPTGKGWAQSDVRRLLDTGIPVVVDQAYLECGYAESFVPLLAHYSNLVITRTMSKGFGLGGLRVGYLLGSPELIDLVTRVRIPFSLTMMSIWGCLAALEEPGYLESRQAYISSQADRLYEGMSAISGIQAFPSDGNFVLADISGTGLGVDELVSRLLEERILIRAMSAHGLKGSHVRVTVGTGEQNGRFLDLLGSLAADATASRR
ncbi:MAG: histidinol-phosphate transaminase [Nostocoides sp.]